MGGSWPNLLATPPPDGVQRLLATYRWDADQMRDDLQGCVVEHLGDPGGVGSSCRFGRQWYAIVAYGTFLIFLGDVGLW